MLSVVPSIEEHPLPALLAAGVRCSLNADDPLLFGPNLLDEYELVRDRMGLDDAALAGIARTSLDASGAPDALKARARAAIDALVRGRELERTPHADRGARATPPPRPPSARRSGSRS